MSMDDLAKYNRERWNALVQANVLYSQPWLDLDETKARQRVDEQGIMGDVRGKKVLCLAGGGGQQGPALALLGAEVTVIDLADEQLAREREAHAHLGTTAHIDQGDMRDLSRYETDSFDIVWQPYSINFVPDVRPVFDEVARVLRPGGLFRTSWSNPITKGVEEDHWTGSGYTLKQLYRDSEMQFDSPDWTFEQADGSIAAVEGPREFNHKLSTFLNALAERNFVLLGLWEDQTMADPNAEPGTWEHLTAVTPPWFDLWLRYLPDLNLLSR